MSQVAFGKVACSRFLAAQALHATLPSAFKEKRQSKICSQFKAAFYLSEVLKSIRDCRGRIIYFSDETLGMVITAVAVVSPFSFALLEFTHFQSHSEKRDFVRWPP